MRNHLKQTGAAIALLLILAACAPMPAATVPAPSAPAATIGPAATEAPGSTQAAPATGVATEPTATTEPAPTTVEPSPTLAPAPASPEAVTPAPTEPPAPIEAPAIACSPGALTPAQTEGPYYTANPPETASLFQPDMPGTKLTVTGYVLDEQCRPIPGARVDFWQADAAGQYDNAGYTLRGYQLTDAAGRYSMVTVVPGEYPGRTPHIHVKITPPGGATLTSQLYLPDAVANTTDRIFSPELVVKLEEEPDGLVGTFNFVVATR